MESHDCQTDPLRVNFVGPSARHDVVVNGWRVPFLDAELVGEDRVVLLLDRRIGVELSTYEAERLVPFLADAVAVALGYGAHPREGTEPPLERLPYPRPRRVTEIVAVGEEG